MLSCTFFSKYEHECTLGNWQFCFHPVLKAVTNKSILDSVDKTSICQNGPGGYIMGYTILQRAEDSCELIGLGGWKETASLKF